MTIHLDGGGYLYVTRWIHGAWDSKRTYPWRVIALATSLAEQWGRVSR